MPPLIIATPLLPLIISSTALLIAVSSYRVAASLRLPYIIMLGSGCATNVPVGLTLIKD